MVRQRLLWRDKGDVPLVARAISVVCRPAIRLARQPRRPIGWPEGRTWRRTFAWAMLIGTLAGSVAAAPPSLPLQRPQTVTSQASTSEAVTEAVTRAEPAVAALSEGALAAPQVLAEAEIAGLAAERAWTATLLQRQANQLAAQDAGRHRWAAPATALTRCFLRGQAARQRGDAIAAALQGHYALRMLLEQESLLESSLQTAGAQQTQIDRAIELGLTTPGDEARWQVQSAVAELRDRRAQVQGRIAEIRQQLAARLQAPWLCNYLPADSLDAALPPGDCARWCQDALAGRADYRSWQQIRCRIDESSLPEVQRLVDQLIPGWTAGVAPPASWLRHLPLRLASRRSSELGQLQSQLASAVQGWGEQICAEVQTAAAQLETALQRAALAQEQLEPVEQQWEHVRQLAQIGQDDGSGETRWMLRYQKAQLEHLARLGEAKQAEIELRRLMGFWD